MLKKKFAAMIAAALMTMSASSAFAAFADLELIRVYYDRAGSEFATDLGNVKTILDNAKQPGGVTFDGSFGTLSTGYAVYFALDRNGFSHLWATGKVGVDHVIVGDLIGINPLKSGISSMYILYNANATDGGTEYTGPAAATSSYKNKLSATQGWLANSINAASRLNTEASLAGVIGSETGSITQALYFWDNALTTAANEKIGVLAATITTNSTGTSTIVAAPTPIPPAFLLMGSGLLGMVGLRRKSKNA